jgi:hypothetical protein
MPEPHAREPELRPDQLYSAAQVAALLNISRASFFRLAWFRTRKVHVTPQRVCYRACDVALYQSICRGAA